MTPAGGGWIPQIGAWPAGAGFRVRVWAPLRQRVEVVLHPGGAAERRHPLDRSPDGFHAGVLDAAAGARYAFLLDGEGPFPDPASRWQPDGVYGPSALIDPHTFRWSDAGWPGVRLEDLVIYEAHVGTFSPEGTYAGAVARLEHLRELGVTALELMPVSDFPGRRNWGYDGVDLFAPARCYGSPDDLRRLVDAAHGHGIAVLVDVVYNHFGPDAAYHSQFSPYYFSAAHRTPWGDALNLDGFAAAEVRSFFVENALHWVHEYHVDGLRLDATHALVDDSPRHFLRELAERVHGAEGGRHVLLIAEDHRNLAESVKPAAGNGWGLDAVWADDFHHQVRRITAGDTDGYFGDFSGTTADLAETVRRGWFHTGQYSAYHGGPRGTDPAGILPRRMVFYLQNHDQVGNRAFGERLHHQIDPAVFRAALALLLFAPETPLLFMGQEWAASAPFLYFTDHHPELGALVASGRQREFSRFAAFTAPDARGRIPDPQAESTFEASRLDWNERTREPHAGVERLHRALIALRRRCLPAETLTGPGAGFAAAALDADTIAVLRRAAPHGELLMVARLRGSGGVDARRWDAVAAESQWGIEMTTEDPAFAGDPRPPEVMPESRGLLLRFARPSAVVLWREVPPPDVNAPSGSSRGSA